MDLPVDILLNVFALLPIPSVLALRRTCKAICEVTHLRPLWAHLFRVHVLDQYIPFPDTSLAAHDLEALTRRALTLRRTWSSPAPFPRRQLTFTTGPAARIIFLQFLPGRSNRWLISVSMTDKPKSYLLQCWDLAGSHPRCIAELRHTDGPYGGVVLNSDPSSTAVLAMQSAQTETFSIRFDAEDPECGFETEATIDGIRELHLLSGNKLVTRRRVEDGGALCLWDLDDLTQEKVQLLNPSIVQPDDRIHAIHIAHDYAVVVRIQSLEIYSTTPRQNLVPIRGAPIAYPLAQFRFQWRTDTVVLCEQHAPVSHFLSSSSPLSSSSSSPSVSRPSSRSRSSDGKISPDFPPRPIHLFVRFASIYPWPVNVLHHYALSPNATYRTRESIPNISMPTTEYNLPYDPHPRAMHTIGSPVRLFGQSTVALGRYGTALWVDNHTEEWLGPSERGQRLAGRMVGVGPSEGMSCNGKASRDGLRTRSGTPTVAPATSAEPGVTGDVQSSGAASMVFKVCADDTWTRVAMEEEAGRIALGHVDGAITLLEY